jgi:hypothetical protein
MGILVPSIRRLVCSLLVLGAVTFAAPPLAEAKTGHASPYTYEQTYGSALRLVKVDLGLKITDQDAEWGYFLFEYTSRESANKVTRGSFEFVRTADGVQVWLQLASMPSYHERVIIDKLARKLGEEHGTPPPKPKPKPEEKPKKGDESDKGGKGDRDRSGDKKPSGSDEPGKSR